MSDEMKKIYYYDEKMRERKKKMRANKSYKFFFVFVLGKREALRINYLYIVGLERCKSLFFFFFLSTEILK